MLGYDNRLTKKEDFDRLKKEGKIIQSDNFALVYFKRNDNDPSRFGFVVSTKISKEAVVRNKVKRSLREAVRQSISQLVKGHDFVFLAKPTIARKYTHEIMIETKEIFKKGKFVK